MNLPGFDHVLAGLGRGDVGLAAMLSELYPDEDSSVPERQPNAFERLVDRVRGSSNAVRIQGLENLMVRYSQCCQPVPGDDVIGYITRGRGISIHRTDCPNVLQLGEHPERRVEIEWKAEAGDRFFVRLIVEGDEALFNPYGIIPVNPHKHKHAKYELAMALVAWMTAPECQQMIAEYSVMGERLYHPSAAEPIP